MALHVGGRGGGVAYAGARVTHSASQSIATGVTTPLAFDTDIKDTDGFHDTVVNNSKIIIPAGKAGTYDAAGLIRYDGNAIGIRRAAIILNGVIVLYSEINNAGAAGRPTPHVVIIGLDLVAGDELQLAGFQNTGVGLLVLSELPGMPMFAVQRQG